MVSLRSGQREGSYAVLESDDAIVSRLARQDRVPWYSKPNLRFLYFLMAPTCLGAEIATGFDASMMNGLQAVPSWVEYYNHPRSASLGLMTATYALGSMAALPFVPIAVDKFGRRYPILLGAIMSIAGSLLQGFALNFTMFIVARFVLGFASAFCLVAASSLIGELSHPKERAVLCSLFCTSYDVGSVSAAATTLGTFAMTSNWGWRIPSFLQVVPSLLQATLLWFVPESPRWLVSRGRGDEAYAVLVKYHAEGDENSEFVKAEYAEIEEALEAELRVGQMSKETLSSPGMRKRVVIAASLGLFSQWCGDGLTSYFLSPILDNIGIHDNQTKNIINLAQASWSLVNGTFIAIIVSQYPRRRMFLTSAISIFVIFTAWTIASAEYSVSGSDSSALVVLFLIFLFNPASNGFFALFYTYLVELFPFHVRARGITIYQWFNRGGGFLNQFVNPIGIEIAGWRWYILYCVWNAFQVVFIYFVFPETSGRTLEELTLLYESGQEALGHGVETLREHGENERYGTMESTCRRTVYGEQR